VERAGGLEDFGIGLGSGWGILEEFVREAWCAVRDTRVARK